MDCISFAREEGVNYFNIRPVNFHSYKGYPAKFYFLNLKNKIYTSPIYNLFLHLTIYLMQRTTSVLEPESAPSPFLLGLTFGCAANIAVRLLCGR
jgi:hypothetical protein